MDRFGRLARWRVPLGWALGLTALYLSRPTMGTLLAGSVVALSGEGLRLWASGHLEKNQRLTTEGPYAWTRNPLYLGSLLVGMGFCFATGRPVLLVLLAGFFAAVYLPVMRREATRLEQAFPSDYTRYAGRVPLFLPRPPSPSGGPAADAGRFSWGRVRTNREHWTVLGVVVVIAILGGKLWVLGGS